MAAVGRYTFHTQLFIFIYFLKNKQKNKTIADVEIPSVGGRLGVPLGHNKIPPFQLGARAAGSDRNATRINNPAGNRSRTHSSVISIYIY